jgi:hypothetical protein
MLLAAVPGLRLRFHQRLKASLQLPQPVIAVANELIASPKPATRRIQPSMWPSGQRSATATQSAEIAKEWLGKDPQRAAS